MMRKDLTGQRFGRLTVLAPNGSDASGRATWLCQCDCGNQSVVATQKLTCGHTTSCGCARKGVNMVDLTGKRFGRLTVLHLTGEKRGSSLIWHCACDCGKTADVASTDLRKGYTRSCGCLSEEVHAKTIRKARDTRNIYYVDGTDVLSLCQDVGPRNTSGVVGVSFDRSVDLWKASIQFKRRIYRLGSSRDKNVAIALRKDAEEHLHGEFLEWYYSTHPDAKKKKDRK